MFKSQPMDDKLSLIGAWSGHVTHYKVLVASITGIVRFCTRVGYINFDNRMTYHQQKARGCCHVTVLKFCRLSWYSAHRAGLSVTAELLVLETVCINQA